MVNCQLESAVLFAYFFCTCLVHLKRGLLLGSHHIITAHVLHPPSCSRCKDGGDIEIRQKVHEAAQIEVVGFLSAWSLMDPYQWYPDPQILPYLPCQAAKSSPSVLCTEITPAKCLHFPASCVSQKNPRKLKLSAVPGWATADGEVCQTHGGHQ